ncbi:hypothetical protein AB0200_26905, partial [Klebsiella pneumoniae]
LRAHEHVTPAELAVIFNRSEQDITRDLRAIPPDSMSARASLRTQATQAAHPSHWQIELSSLGAIEDEKELAGLESHLQSCESCAAHAKAFREAQM